MSVGPNDFSCIARRLDFEIELRTVLPQLCREVSILARFMQVEERSQLPPCSVLKRVGHVALPAKEDSIDARLYDEVHVAPRADRQQLKLNEEQMRSAVGCHMTRDEYIEILRGKGII